MSSVVERSLPASIVVLASEAFSVVVSADMLGKVGKEGEYKESQKISGVVEESAVVLVSEPLFSVFDSTDVLGKVGNDCE